MNYVENYKPILTPTNTGLSIQAWLYDTTNIVNPNRYGEFEFSFVPCTVQDHYRLTEAIEQAVWKTEERNWDDPIIEITPRPDCLDAKKNFRCSQLFAPKLNIDADDALLYHQGELEASLKLHLRDGPDGTVFLQCEYGDVLSPSNGLTDDVIGESTDNCDTEEFDDWWTNVQIGDDVIKASYL